MFINAPLCLDARALQRLDLWRVGAQFALQHRGVRYAARVEAGLVIVQDGGRAHEVRYTLAPDARVTPRQQLHCTQCGTTHRAVFLMQGGFSCREPPREMWRQFGLS